MSTVLFCFHQWSQSVTKSKMCIWALYEWNKYYRPLQFVFWFEGIKVSPLAVWIFRMGNGHWITIQNSYNDNKTKERNKVKVWRTSNCEKKEWNNGSWEMNSNKNNKGILVLNKFGLNKMWDCGHCVWVRPQQEIHYINLSILLVSRQ